jgi:hypothetical protein
MTSYPSHDLDLDAVPRPVDEFRIEVGFCNGRGGDNGAVKPQEALVALRLSVSFVRGRPRRSL